MRIAINGFGRIGRTILRQVLTDPRHADIEVVAINDIAPLETCAYLFRYDSVFGPFPGAVTTENAALHVAGRHIRFSHTPDLGALDMGGVDVLLECTGKVKTAPHAHQGLSTGAQALLISGPSDGAEVTCVLGANEAAMGEARIISNASCTTNAVAPLLRALHDTAGVVCGHMTTVHVYTGSQPMVDAPRGETLERSRAGAVSMVPTSTSAMQLIDHVLPELAGRVTGAAVRVPAISVSAVDLVVTLDRCPQDLNTMIRDMAQASPVMATITDPCVSTDLKARPESLILALPELRQSGPQARIFGWYDNEWGFSARMLDMARLIAAR